MFESVRGLRRELTRVRPAVAVALALHGGLLALALLWTPRAPDRQASALPPLHLPRSGGTRGGTSNPPSVTPASVPPKKARRPVTTRPSAPAAPQPPRAQPAPSSDGDTSGTDTRGDDGGPGDGSGTPSCAGALCGNGAGPLVEEDVVAVLPRLLAGPPVQLSPEARRTGVSGRMLVRCTIGADGAVRDCDVLRGLPLADAAVLAALQARTYAPAQVDGRPVAVRHLFSVDVRR